MLNFVCVLLKPFIRVSKELDENGVKQFWLRRFKLLRTFILTLVIVVTITLLISNTFGLEMGYSVWLYTLAFLIIRLLIGILFFSKNLVSNWCIIVMLLSIVSQKGLIYNSNVLSSWLVSFVLNILIIYLPLIVLSQLFLFSSVYVYKLFLKKSVMRNDIDEHNDSLAKNK